MTRRIATGIVFMMGLFIAACTGGGSGGGPTPPPNYEPLDTEGKMAFSNVASKNKKIYQNIATWSESYSEKTQSNSQYSVDLGIGFGTCKWKFTPDDYAGGNVGGSVGGDIDPNGFEVTVEFIGEDCPFILKSHVKVDPMNSNQLPMIVTGNMEMNFSIKDEARYEDLKKEMDVVSFSIRQNLHLDLNFDQVGEALNLTINGTINYSVNGLSYSEGSFSEVGLVNVAGDGRLGSEMKSRSSALIIAKFARTLSPLKRFGLPHLRWDSSGPFPVEMDIAMNEDATVHLPKASARFVSRVRQKFFAEKPSEAVFQINGEDVSEAEYARLRAQYSGSPAGMGLPPEYSPHSCHFQVYNDQLSAEEVRRLLAADKEPPQVNLLTSGSACYENYKSDRKKEFYFFHNGRMRSLSIIFAKDYMQLRMTLPPAQFDEKEQELKSIYALPDEDEELVRGHEDTVLRFRCEPVAACEGVHR